MKVAIVHYWLFHMRGGERVVEALCELYPDADVFTHVYDASGVTDAIRRHDVKTTFIGSLPRARTRYTHYLPLMPLALRLLDLRGYDLVISSESGPAKGVRADAGAAHVCYCHTPMRYAWDMREEYLETLPRMARPLARPLLAYMRRWDVRSAAGVDAFVANSSEVRDRIRRYYGRGAAVVPPPVDVERFAERRGAGSAAQEEYYLVVSHLVRYKRIDLAVQACTRLGRRLKVVGTGAESERLRQMAGAGVEFLGWQPDDGVAELMRNARALLFPGLEDFGIAPVESMAAGRPVIAYGRGGVLDTVRPGETGLLFPEQSVESLMAAIRQFEARESSFDPERLRAHASQFTRDRFKNRMSAIVQQTLAEKAAGGTTS